MISENNNTNIKIEFWGVRGSVPSPGPNTTKYGGNTSCVSINFGDKVLILDAGTGIRNLGSELIKTPKKTVIARSKKQSDYINALSNNDITVALGPAGTGKSFLAVSVAITMLFEKKVEKVILKIE